MRILRSFPITIFFIIISALLGLSLTSCTGEEGDQGPPGEQGPQGLKGDPGEPGDDGIDGSPDTPEQILSKLIQVDGAGSGLDADTLDGYQASSFWDEFTSLGQRVSALESQVSALQATLDDHTSQLQSITQRLQARHAELLFAWDGDGRYLGRVIGLHRNSIVYHDAAIGIPIEVFVVDPSGNINGSYQYRSLVFESLNCSGNALMRASDASNLMGVLDQTSGRIYTPTDISGNYTGQSIAFIVEGGFCNNVANSGTFVEYTLARAITPFTPGVFVAPAQW